MEMEALSLATPARSTPRHQYQHTLDALVDAQQQRRRASFSHKSQRTPPSALSRRRGSFGGALTRERRSSALRVAVRDITGIASVTINVVGYQYDSSIMEHPEFLIQTRVVFQCQQQFGAQFLETTWRLHRTFQDFQGLDLQLRQKFPFDMSEIAPPRRHRRRSFFRMHRSKGFLTRRALELNEYMAEVLGAAAMRLTRFLDPRAPLILRCFCNFDVGFGKKLRVLPAPQDACVLCLDNYDRSRDAAPLPITPTPDADTTHTDGHRLQLQELEKLQTLRQQSASHFGGSRSSAPSRADSKMDELEANLLDDKARNLAMCQRYACSCHLLSLRLTEGKMSRILRLRGYRQVFRPTDADGPTALFCVLFRLQQHNDLDRKLHDILHDYGAARTESTFTVSDDDGDERETQLLAGVELLREALASYALLHVHALEPHFRTRVVDLTRKIHEFKTRQQQRVGAMELVLLCTMLDLTIVLITDDHEGTVQEIFPLPGLAPIRHGGRLLVTLSYILPTMHCVNGRYALVDNVNPQEAGGARLDAALWQGLDEMDRNLVALIDRHVMQSELRRFEAFDAALAEPLNRAILDAVWNDCQYNPNLFNMFERQAQQFGKSRTTASQFFQYMEIAFGVEGATYLVDFLLHVLPEATLRKQLLRARWRRVQKQLTRRRAAVAS